jgi:hypothetical protein
VNRDIDIALDEIAKALTEADLSTEAVLDVLFEMSASQTTDDAAALLITWRGKSSDLQYGRSVDRRDEVGPGRQLGSKPIEGPAYQSRNLHL